MKKKKIKKLFFVCLTKSVVISFLVSLFIVVPVVFKFTKAREDALSNKFFGKKAEYQGVITLWNIDTFEGGSASKTSFLESVSLKFEKENKGVYIKVDNITVDELESRLKENKKPDMFSFGAGVQDYLKDDMVNLTNDVLLNVKSNFLSCGASKGEIKAVAWSYSIYYLISSLTRIDKAGKVYKNNLKELALELDFDKKLNKSVRHTYSLTFGGNKYVNALNIFNREFDRNIINEVKLQKIDENYNKNTFYEAYVNFINNKSSVIIGTNRDLFRLENRKNAGKEVDIIYEPFLSYTDLVNYISIINNEEKIKIVCEDFLIFLMSEKIQKGILNIGLFSTTNSNLYDSGVLCQIEKQLNSQLVVENIF